MNGRFASDWMHEYPVEEVLDQWYRQEQLFFKVRVDDGKVYILRHQTSMADGEPELVSGSGALTRSYGMGRDTA